MGFDGIIFTVDLAVLGNRELDKRAKLTESGVSLLLRSHHLLSETDSQSSTSQYGVGAVAPTDILNVQNRAADPDMTWSVSLPPPLMINSDSFAPHPSRDDVTWLKSITKLPIIVKGIQDVEDVALAAKYGADAVVLSNHGGRCEFANQR
jgi:L-lactate dehydrogenase (cytochrome)